MRITGEGVRRETELFLGTSHEVDDLLGATAQSHAGLSERDVPATPLKETHAKVSLELLHLTRERGLRDVQRGCGTGDRPLARDHEEVPKVSQLHVLSPSYAKSACNHIQYRNYTC